MIDEPGYMLGAERRKNLGLKANEELYDPKTNVRAAKALDSRPRGLVSHKSGAYKQYLPELSKQQGFPLLCHSRLHPSGGWQTY